MSYKAGTYTASAEGNNGPVTVEVTFSDTEILSVEVKVEELNCDVVIVGAGAAGTAAALSASEAGSKVILLEKTSTPSGAGTMAGVLFASHSDLQIEAGKTVDEKWLYDQYVGDSSYFANNRLVTTIIQNSSDTVNWLIDNGVNLTLLDAGYGSQYAHVGMPTTAHGYVDGGSVAINTLIDKIKSLGNEVMFDTKAEDLIYNDDKTVGGVIATTADGRQLHIKAKSVVLATGGFGGNEEMMAERFGKKAGTALVKSNTGDGIKMAWNAGAAELGADAGGMYGNNYVVFEGGTLGFAYTSGKLAGAHAAANVKQS